MRVSRLLPSSALLAGVVLASPLAYADPPVGADASVPPTPAHFRLGQNYGYTQGWDNHQKTTIAANAGTATSRISLPGGFLDMWGYDIETVNGDMDAYQAAGYADLTAFLDAPKTSDSNAPQQGQEAQYSPKNLYEPIWSSPGVVNPANTWAVYVQKTVTQYKDSVKVWEIWNEPDFTSDFTPTMTTWWTSPPDPTSLSNWHDSIYAYVRLLRVSYEVAKSIDPGCFIATGGLGYESFLDAVARYTDNPADGSVTADYPATGGAWFDALSIHHYPQYGVYDDASMTWHTDVDSDSMADNLAIAIDNMTGVLAAHGYDGSQKPAKALLCTETGLSSVAIGTTAGGDTLMRNYFAKMPVTAFAKGMFQVHWFDLNDDPDSANTDPYKHMGLYYDITGQTPATAMRKKAAAAYGTASSILTTADYDPASTAALSLPSGVRGYVFRTADGRKAYALWARVSTTSEDASATLMLPTTVSLEEHDWDSFDTKSAPTITPSGGVAALTLDGTTKYFLETTASDPAGGGGSGGSGSSAGGSGNATGGSSATGGSGNATGGSGSATGGSSASGGAGNATGGASATGGATSAGTGGASGHGSGAGGASAGQGGAKATGGSSAANGGAAAHAGTSGGTGGDGGTAGANGATPAADSGDSGGCGCRVATSDRGVGAWASVLLGLGWMARRKRRDARSR